jgi:hypothetical protein
LQTLPAYDGRLPDSERYGRDDEVYQPAGDGTGAGSGQAAPIYTGTTPTVGTRVLAKQKEVIKKAGGKVTDSILQTAIGE